MHARSASNKNEHNGGPHVRLFLALSSLVSTDTRLLLLTLVAIVLQFSSMIDISEKSPERKRRRTELSFHVQTGTLVLLVQVSRRENDPVTSSSC